MTPTKTSQIRSLRHANPDLGDDQIASALGVKLSLVKRVLGYPPGTTERILALRTEGRSYSEIAIATGLDINKVRSDVERSSVRMTAEQRAASHRKYPESIRSQVLDLRRAGASLPKITELTGIDKGTIAYWCGLNDVRLTEEQFSANLREHTSEQDTAILEARNSGLSRREIASSVGVPLSYVKTVLVSTGTTIPMELRTRNSQIGKGGYYEKVKLAFLDRVESKGGTILSEYVDYKTPVVLECSRLHRWKIPPANIMNSDAWCGACFRMSMTGSRSPNAQIALQLVGYETHLEWYRAIAAAKGGLCLGTENTLTHTKIEWECAKGHRWLAKPNTLMSCNSWCPNCANVGPSKGQIEVMDYISFLLPEETVQCDNKTVLNPRHLDVYVPSRSFALEYNGLWYHSTAMSAFEPNKERAKALGCHEQGISFMMIYEDEWKNKPDLIKSMIRRRLGRFNGQKLHARKLTLKEVRPWDLREFFERNHLDGSVQASLGYALFLGDKVVMAATVRTSFHNGDRELARMATDYDFAVAGGASRLVKAIKKKLGSRRLVSYSNNRLSSGDVYRKMGAVEITETTAPSYYYTDCRGTTRIWRFQCKRINDPKILAQFPDVPHHELDQAEAGMFSMRHFGDNRPLFKIEDCGSKKWLL